MLFEPIPETTSELMALNNEIQFPLTIAMVVLVTLGCILGICAANSSRKGFALIGFASLLGGIVGVGGSITLSIMANADAVPIPTAAEQLIVEAETTYGIQLTNDQATALLNSEQGRVASERLVNGPEQPEEPFIAGIAIVQEGDGNPQIATLAWDTEAWVLHMSEPSEGLLTTLDIQERSAP